MTDHAPVRSGRQSPQWPIKASEITVRLAVVAAGALALGWLLLYLRVVTIPIFVALLITTVLVPPVRWLTVRGWPSLAATWAVILAAIGIIAGIGGATGRRLSS